MPNSQTLWGAHYRPTMAALLSCIAIVSYNNLAATAVLPEIGEDLGRISLLAWVITIELFTASLAVLATGPIVDAIGVRKTANYTGIGFIITSLLAAAAPSMPLLVLARAVQGVFAGGVLTVATTGIGIAIPAHLRPRAFASLSTVWGVMGLGGPAIAAALVTVASWRAVFAVNVVVAGFALAIGWRTLPGQQGAAVETVSGNAGDANGSVGTKQRKVDVVGLALVGLITAAILSLTASSTVLLTLAAFTLPLAIGLYLAWVPRTPEPILRLRHLGAKQYWSVHATSMAVLGTGVGLNSFLPLYMSSVRSQSTSTAAFSVLYLTFGWTMGAWMSSRLQDRMRGEVVSVVGSLIASPTAAFISFAVFVDANLVVLGVAFGALGLGVGTITSTGAALLQSRTERSEMGRLNAIHQFLRTIAATIGIAAVAAITFAVVGQEFGDVEAVRSLLGNGAGDLNAPLVDALRRGFGLATAGAAAVAALAIPSALHLFRNRHNTQPVTPETPNL